MPNIQIQESTTCTVPVSSKISIFFGLIQDKDNSYTHFYRKIQILYDVFVFSLKHIVFTFNLQGFFLPLTFSLFWPLTFSVCSHYEDPAAGLSVSAAALHGPWSVAGGRGKGSRGVQLQDAQEHAQSSYTSR